jgi:hypothetical protein
LNGILNTQQLPQKWPRPGGPLKVATFVSNATGSTFRLLADNGTTHAVAGEAWRNCRQLLKPGSGMPSRRNGPVWYNDTSPNGTTPSSAVQYYRASSAVLTLDGYNNTAVLENSTNGPTDDVPLPNYTDLVLLDCLNNTIGTAVPLIDNAAYTLRFNSFTVYPVMWVWFIWILLRRVL